MSKNLRSNPDTSETTISRDIHVKGDISSDNDMWIDGHVEGNVTTQGIATLGQNARVDGDVTARNIRVNGHVHGNLAAQESLVCETAAVIHGDIATPDLSVESGAFIKGAVLMPSEERQGTEEE